MFININPLDWSIYPYELILMNYNDEQILTNHIHWVDMAKSTPFSYYWQMHTDMTMSVWIYPYGWYQQIYPDKLIFINLPCWVDIDEYTPLNLYRLVYTEKSILMNPCLQININKYIWWVDINESIIDLTSIKLPWWLLLMNFHWWVHINKSI